MLQKPTLTETQKRKSEQEFRSIIAEAPNEVQEKWDGQIMWSPIDELMLNGRIQNRLTGRLADRFVTLLNKINDRRI